MRMKMQEKNGFSFIEETISPDKKTKRKKHLNNVKKTIVYAPIFGIVASAFFIMSNIVLEKIYLQTNGNVIPAIPTKDPEDKSAFGTNSESENVSTKDGTDKINLLSNVQALVTKLDSTIVSVNGVKDGVDWLDNPEIKSKATFGLVLQIKDMHCICYQIMIM